MAPTAMGIVTHNLRCPRSWTDGLWPTSVFCIAYDETPPPARIIPTPTPADGHEWSPGPFGGWRAASASGSLPERHRPGRLRPPPDRPPLRGGCGWVRLTGATREEPAAIAGPAAHRGGTGEATKLHKRRAECRRRTATKTIRRVCLRHSAARHGRAAKAAGLTRHPRPDRARGRRRLGLGRGGESGPGPAKSPAKSPVSTR